MLISLNPFSFTMMAKLRRLVTITVRVSVYSVDFLDGGVNRFYYDMNKPAGYAIVRFNFSVLGIGSCCCL